MGEANINKYLREKRNAFLKSIPLRLFKGSIAFVFTLPLIPFALFGICAKENKWPWEL